MIVIVLLLFLMLALVGGGWFFFLRKKEGDDCKVKSPDDNAVSYEIDADGECVLMTCASGYDKVGQTCVKQADAAAATTVAPLTSSKFNKPVYCIRGKPKGMASYAKLYADASGQTGGSGPGARHWFASDASKRMFFEQDSNGVPTGKGQLEDPDDHAGNIKYIREDIYMKEGEYPTFMAATTRYLEYPLSAQGIIWVYTTDPNWMPDDAEMLELDENKACNLGREFLPIGSGKASNAIHKIDKDTYTVYDVRDTSKLANYQCRRPEVGSPGALTYDFEAIDRDAARAQRECVSKMGCTTGEQCYPVMQRGDSNKYGCVKCTSMN